MIQENCDGIRLKAFLKAGLKWVGCHRSHLDIINLHPAPDADTGTNIHATLSAAWNFAKKADRKHAGQVADAAAKGSLRGAMGCSGIIFANFLIGFADSSKAKEIFSAEDFAMAFLNGASRAHQGIANPRQGMILTLTDRLADFAMAVTAENKGLPQLMDALYLEAKEALLSISQMRKVSENLDSPDAGVEGFFYFLEGIYRYSHKEPLSICPAEQVDPAPLYKYDSAWDGKYSLEFVIKSDEIAIEKIKESFQDPEENMIIAKKDDSAKIHIYTCDPRRVFDKISRFGKLSNIKIKEFSRKAN